MTQNNIILTGMPGAGKSTIGVLLAKETGKAFVDTDILIQTREGKTLQTILDDTDYLTLRQIEESVLLTLSQGNQVIATGGSAVYSKPGMRHLKKNASIVFLDVPIAQLLLRIDNFDTRGIARGPDQSFQSLFDEREVLYREYADITIHCGHLPPAEIVRQIISCLQKLNAD